MASRFPPEPLRAIVEEVASLLKARKETISVAETAAGGLISAALLATPGASGFYKGGLTVYTLESRVAFAGWTQTNIDNYKGPSPEVVSGLAQNVRQKLGSTYTVCEVGINTPQNKGGIGEFKARHANGSPFMIQSGTAGPTGGTTRNRTPGYVALAVASESGTVSREVETGLGGDREANMLAFAAEALKLVGSMIKGEAKM